MFAAPLDDIIRIQYYKSFLVVLVGFDFSFLVYVLVNFAVQTSIPLI